jgi:uncharacterized protein YqhQ
MAMDLFYKAAGALISPFRYAEREMKNLKENLKEDAQEALASALKLIVAGISSLLFLLFVSIAAAIAINRSMNNDFAGFAIVAGFYLIIGVIMYIWNASDKKKMQHTKNQLKEMA